MEDDGVILCLGCLESLESRDFLNKMHIGDQSIYTDEDIAGACDANSWASETDSKCFRIHENMHRTCIKCSIFIYIVRYLHLYL